MNRMYNNFLRAVFAAMLAGFISTWLVGTSKADLIIEFGSTSFSPGGSGSIDVFVRSSDGLDSFNFFSAKFQIVPVNGPGFLYFKPSFDSMSPNDASKQTNAEVNTDSYVFYLDSQSFDASVNEVPPLNMVQSDFATSNKPVPTAIQDRFLLASLDLYHQTEGAGDASYRVFLVEDSDQTFFENLDQDRLGVDSRSYSNSGLVTITSVPEPSTTVLLVGSLCGFVFARRRID